MSKPRRVQIEIVLPDGVPKDAVDVGLYVEDVSRADAASEVVGEGHARRSLEPGGVLRMTVDVPDDAIDEKRTYAVRVHLDVSGSGQMEKGDLISTASHPVLTRGHGTSVRVPVKRI